MNRKGDAAKTLTFIVVFLITLVFSALFLMGSYYLKTQKTLAPKPALYVSDFLADGIIVNGKSMSILEGFSTYGEEDIFKKSLESYLKTRTNNGEFEGYPGSGNEICLFLAKPRIGKSGEFDSILMVNNNGEVSNRLILKSVFDKYDESINLGKISGVSNLGFIGDDYKVYGYLGRCNYE